MTEEFLHYIWQYRLFKPEAVLESGHSLQVLQPGSRNTDAGPDFFNARISIGDTVWAGNIEIHILASDWARHNHTSDPAYQNVILHVVWRNDVPVTRANGELIPTLQLEGLFNQNAWKNYLAFMASQQWIPCQNMFAEVDSLTRLLWLERVLIERLERKALQVEHILQLTNHNWQHTFYRLLARNMGFKLNNQAFEMLAQSLPYNFLARHADDLFQVEAMVFGQAGMLEQEFTDEYPLQLKKEYSFLKSKFALTPIDGHLWRFMRLHPGNFPTLRLAQFAAIIHKSAAVLNTLFDTSDAAGFRQLLSAAASSYWLTHYNFGKPSAPRAKTLGRASADLLIINLVAPLLLAYGRRRNNNLLTARPVDLLMQLPGENNAIIRQWATLGADTATAASTQALLELKTSYCDARRCLSCRIGNEILKR